MCSPSLPPPPHCPTLRIATSASRVTNGLRLLANRHLYLLSYAQTAAHGGLKWQVHIVYLQFYALCM